MDREAFKRGFLEKCAEDGLSADEILQRIRFAKVAVGTSMEKTAAWPLVALLLGDRIAGMLERGATQVWDATKTYGVPFALLAPPALGATGGLIAANMVNQDYDPDEARKRELAAEYQRSIEGLDRLKKKLGIAQ